MSQNQIGVIGLAVMGKNLAKNFASKNITTSVFNRSYAKTQELLDEKNPNLQGYESLKDFVDSLQLPRKIILMVKAGDPVDQTIAELEPFLDDGDIILDCGNSNYNDTARRQRLLATKNLQFIGCGVSGGEEGALHGPSIMPGGEKIVVEKVLPLLEQVSAKDFDGKPCTTNVGSGASGHFVKMVHNGIEYAIMQGISEVYWILKNQGYANPELKSFFDRANKYGTESFLLEITTKVLESKTTDDRFLLDLIVDQAKAKGTGGWTVEAALKLGVYTPTIAASVFARIASARNQTFVANFSKHSQEKYPDNEILEHYLLEALEAVFLASYLQGLDLISQANTEYNWDINLSEAIRIWQGGCIIRSQMLSNLWDIYQKPIEVTSRIQATDFISNFNFLPTPVLASTRDYFLTLTSKNLPTNLIQAQRDFFGAHTYKRTDLEGDFSGGWSNS